jgi:hypothetical protein
MSLNGLEALLESFRNPPASHRAMPFMVWNGRVTRGYITSRLEEYRRLGFGGVFVHPRPGLITEYLSEEWFELFEFAAAECERLGMECHIYDENSFPAGFGGGHVPAANPLTTTQSLRGKVYTSGPLPGGMTAYVQREGGTWVGVEREKANESVSAERPVMAIELHADSGSIWTGGFPYVDLTLPQTTRTFLEVTHEAYKKRSGGRFGKVTKYAFSDEPMLSGGGGLAFSRYLQAEFRREHGYDIETKLGELVSDTDAGRAVRFDHQMTVQRLFESSFAGPMGQWCERNGLAFTGHFMEHEWPEPHSHPSAMSLLRYMQVPGNDLLGFQFFASKPPASNALYWLNLAELRSVAAQTGATRTLCETCGGGGYAYTLRDIKSCEDFAMAGGVTLVNPHLSHESIAGARRYDWAQTISPHAPWYEAYRPQAEHVARVQDALLAGVDDNRVLVLMPTSSAWLEYLPGSLRTQGYRDAMPALRESQTSLVRLLSQAVVDFDLGDELILRDMGKVEGRLLRAGRAMYEVVVVPEGMENVLASTLELLRAFVAGGGTVLTLRGSAKYVNGRASSESLPGKRVGSREELVAGLRLAVPPRAKVKGEVLPEAVHHRQRGLPDGSRVHFFANPYLEPVTLDVSFPGAVCAVELDTGTGASYVRSSPVMTVTLEPRGHFLVIAASAPLPTRPRPRHGIMSRAALTLRNARRAGDNLLVLDYCDVRTASGVTANSVPCIRADQLVWRDHGMDRNPWRWAIQYRRTYLELPFPSPSGFTLEYRFRVDDGAVLPGLRAAIERPELYDVSINDTPVDATRGEEFFDEEMRAFPIGSGAREGENVLRLVARQMHALCEITPAYVLGDFSLKAAERGFTIAAGSSPGVGSLAKMPFYNRGVVFTFGFETLKPVRDLQVTLPEWAGSVVMARVDDVEIGVFTRSGQTLDAAVNLPAGAHELVLDLRGHLQNQLGPWHAEGLPIPWVWENAPQPQPAGEKYRLLPWGLLASPVVEVG